MLKTLLVVVMVLIIPHFHHSPTTMTRQHPSMEHVLPLQNGIQAGPANTSWQKSITTVTVDHIKSTPSSVPCPVSGGKVRESPEEHLPGQHCQQSRQLSSGISWSQEIPLLQNWDPNQHCHYWGAPDCSLSQKTTQSLGCCRSSRAEWVLGEAEPPLLHEDTEPALHRNCGNDGHQWQIMKPKDSQPLLLPLLSSPSTLLGCNCITQCCSHNVFFY